MIELKIRLTENVSDEDVNHDLKAAHAYQKAIAEAGLRWRAQVGQFAWIENRASTILAELLSGKGEV